MANNPIQESAERENERQREKNPGGKGKPGKLGPERTGVHKAKPMSDAARTETQTKDD